MTPIIEIDKLSKAFTISHGGGQFTTLRDSMMETLRHPFSRRDARERFWALKDVSLTIRRGEVLGIIGKNGAGKSTLLKILGGITKPTEGRARLWGRVSSLLDVGTGFHPELTGRENIFLNGVILGMTRAEVMRKFDEIVAFSGVEKFLDTPVKHYSSGMYVRLAFSIAAHLEPDILIVDEVLAVGDLEFQRRCLGKMEQISQGEGRTVLFVSHNMNAISTLAKRCLYLENGKVSLVGTVEEAVTTYLKKGVRGEYGFTRPIERDKSFITKVMVQTSGKHNIHVHGRPLRITIEFHLSKAVKGNSLSFQVLNPQGEPYVHLWTYDDVLPMGRKPGLYRLTCDIPKSRLYMGEYYLKVYLAGSPGQPPIDIVDGVCPFQVTMLGHVRDYPWEPNTCAYIEDGNWSVSYEK